MITSKKMLMLSLTTIELRIQETLKYKHTKEYKFNLNMTDVYISFMVWCKRNHPILYNYTKLKYGITAKLEEYREIVNIYETILRYQLSMTYDITIQEGF